MLLILFKAKTEYFLMHFLILTILLVLTLFCQANLFSAIHSLYLHVCKYMSCYPSVQNWGTQSSHAQTPFSICSYLSHHRAIVVRQDCKAHYYLPKLSNLKTWRLKRKTFFHIQLISFFLIALWKTTWKENLGKYFHK